MASLENQTDYWNTTGATRTFTHPLHAPWLDHLPRQARILDYGCGYGRCTALAAAMGFAAVEGTDPAPALIDRAREQHPGLTFTTLEDPPNLPHPDASLDAILLFAVLTCIPTDEGQHRLIAELTRVLRPGGLLYLSDMPLQTDRRNLDRYAQGEATYGTYGVFEVGDGAVCRHHSRDHLAALLSGFDLTTRDVPAHTMNANPVTAIQIRAVKPQPR